MTTKGRPQPRAKKEEVEARNPLDAFVRHQARALEETGKAFASLLPKDFRTHANAALEETRASWEALFDGVLDTVECTVGRLRGKPKEGGEKEKVKVEVE